MIKVLVGMISSGKSTYAKQKAKEGWIIINDDAVVNAVHADDYTLYSEKLKPLYKSVEDHILHMAVAMGKDVIVDRGLSNTRKSRQRWLALGRALDVPIWAVQFPLWEPERHAQMRFVSDNRGHTLEYWQKVALRHFENFELPVLDEGFNHIEEYEWRE